MHPFLGSVHHISNNSLDKPLCIIPGDASTTQGPMSSKWSIPRGGIILIQKNKKEIDFKIKALLREALKHDTFKKMLAYLLNYLCV